MLFISRIIKLTLTDKLKSGSQVVFTNSKLDLLCKYDGRFNTMWSTMAQPYVNSYWFLLLFCYGFHLIHFISSSHFIWSFYLVISSKSFHQSHFISHFLKVISWKASTQSFNQSKSVINIQIQSSTVKILFVNQILSHQCSAVILEQIHYVLVQYWTMTLWSLV